MPARNYKIRLFRTVCYKTELGYHFLQGKRKYIYIKKKKFSDTNFRLFESVNGTRNNGQGGTLLTQSSTARYPFHHSYMALDTRRCETEKYAPTPHLFE